MASVVQGQVSVDHLVPAKESMESSFKYKISNINFIIVCQFILFL